MVAKRDRPAFHLFESGTTSLQSGGEYRRCVCHDVFSAGGLAKNERVCFHTCSSPREQADFKAFEDEWTARNWIRTLRHRFHYFKFGNDDLFAWIISWWNPFRFIYLIPAVFCADEHEALGKSNWIGKSTHQESAGTEAKSVDVILLCRITGSKIPLSDDNNNNCWTAVAQKTEPIWTEPNWTGC